MKLRLFHRGRKRVALGCALCAIACAAAVMLRFVGGVGYVERASGLDRLRVMLVGSDMTVVRGTLPPPGFSGRTDPRIHASPMPDMTVTPARWTWVWTRELATLQNILWRNEETIHVWAAWDPSLRVVRFNAWIVPACIVAAGIVLLAWGGLARRRSRDGACEQCGYDRRGLVPGATCPECGAKSLETSEKAA